MTYRIMDGVSCCERGHKTMDSATDALEAIVLQSPPVDWPITLRIEDEESGMVMHIGEWDLTEDTLFSRSENEAEGVWPDVFDVNEAVKP